MIPVLADTYSWEQERCRALHAIMNEVRERISVGVPRTEAYVQVAKAHEFDTYYHARGEEFRRLKCSAATIRRYYPQWEAHSSPEVFRRDYQGGRRQIPGELVTELHRLASLPGIEEFSHAINIVRKNWREGQPVPGLGTWREWWVSNPATCGQALPRSVPDFPFSRSALYRHQPPKAVKKWGNRGEAEARKFLATIRRDYSQLPPARLYTMDDVRLDIICVDYANGGQATLMKCYLMMEASARRIVSFVLRPKNAMLERDVSACLARGLKTGGVGRDYTTFILLEHGSVALSQAKSEWLEQVTQGRVRIIRSRINGGAESFPGSGTERRSGHWMSKGIIEAFMRKLHIRLRGVEGQIGSTYRHQPAQTGFTGQYHAPAPGSIAEEAEKLARINLQLKGRVTLKLPLLNVMEMRTLLTQALQDYNADPDHRCDGFGTIKQREIAPGTWEDIHHQN